MYADGIRLEKYIMRSQLETSTANGNYSNIEDCLRFLASISSG